MRATTMGRVMAVQSPAAWMIACALLLGAPHAISAALAQSATSRADAENAPGVPSRAEELARDANKAFDRFLKGEDPGGVAPAPSAGTVNGTAPERARYAIESGSDWLARVQRSYQAVIERLSEATVPNPVADAAERQAAEQAKLWARRGEVKREPGDRVVIGGGDQGTLIGDARELLDQARREIQGAPVGTLGTTDTTGEVPSAGASAQFQPKEQSNPDARPSDSQTVAQATPELASGDERPAEIEQTADDGGALGWLNRGYRAFQRDVVGKLAAKPKHGQPGPAGDVARATGEPDHEAKHPSGRPEQTTAKDGGTAAFVTSTPASGAGAAGTTPVEPKDALDDARRLEELRRVKMQEATKQAHAAEAAKMLEAEREAEARKTAETARLDEAQAAEAAKKLEAERQTEARKAAEAAKRAKEMARLAELRRAAEQRAVSDARRAKEAADGAAMETARLAVEAKSANGTNAATTPGGGGGASIGQSDAPVQPGDLARDPRDVAGAPAVTPNVINDDDKAKRRAAQTAREAETSARKQAERAAAAVKTIETAKREAELAVDGKARRRADRLIRREAKSAAQAARRAIAATAVLGKVAPVRRPVADFVAPGPIARPDAATTATRRR